MKKRAYGFTIVELLIVIVVIAVLAAISIVAYTGIQNRANDTSVRSDLNNIAKKIEIYRASTDSYPTNTVAALTQALDGMQVAKAVYGNGLNSNATNIIYCLSTDRSKFGLAAWSTSGKAFAVINGLVQDFNYPAAVSATTCPRLVTPYTVGGHFWFKEEGTWRVL